MVEPYDPKTTIPRGPELATDQWQLQFFKNGAIGRMIHTSSGRVLIEPSEDHPAYEITVPAVSYEVWSLEDGRVGIVFANPGQVAHTLSVDVRPLTSPQDSSTIRAISAVAEEVEFSAPVSQLRIPPLDLLLLEIQPNR